MTTVIIDETTERSWLGCGFVDVEGVEEFGTDNDPLLKLPHSAKS